VAGAVMALNRAITATGMDVHQLADIVAAACRAASSQTTTTPGWIGINNVPTGQSFRPAPAHIVADAKLHRFASTPASIPAAVISAIICAVYPSALLPGARSVLATAEECLKFMAVWWMAKRARCTDGGASFRRGVPSQMGAPAAQAHGRGRLRTRRKGCRRSRSWRPSASRHASDGESVGGARDREVGGAMPIWLTRMMRSASTLGHDSHLS